MRLTKLQKSLLEYLRGALGVVHLMLAQQTGFWTLGLL